MDRETVGVMKEGRVIVDVDVDQGGLVEASRPTTLYGPVFVEAGVTHYCVKNVLASVPVSATRALSNALLPYVKKLAGHGLDDALNSEPGPSRAAEGHKVSEALASEYTLDYQPLQSVLPLHAQAR